MKRIFLFSLFYIIILNIFAQTWDNYIGNKLYLVSYNGTYDATNRSVINAVYCRFGEYLQLHQNGILDWNSRLGGTNSSYKYSLHGQRLNLSPIDNSDNNTNIDIFGIDGSNILTRSDDGVLRVYSKQPQPIYTGPAAEITKWWISYNEIRNNENGIVVHVDVQFFKVNGHALRVSAYFDHPENNGLVDTNNRYRGYNSVVCTETNITNNGDNTFIHDLQLFIPISELHLDPHGTVDVACHVFVHDATLGDIGYVLTKTGFQHFNVSFPDQPNRTQYDNGGMQPALPVQNYDMPPCAGCGGTKKCSVCNGKGYTVSASTRRLYHQCGSCEGTGICQVCRFR